MIKFYTTSTNPSLIEADVFIKADMNLPKGTIAEVKKQFSTHQDEMHFGAGAWTKGLLDEDTNLVYMLIKTMFQALDKGYHSAVVDISYCLDDSDVLSFMVDEIANALDELSTSMQGTDGENFRVTVSKYNSKLAEVVAFIDQNCTSDSVTTNPHAFSNTGDDGKLTQTCGLFFEEDDVIIGELLRDYLAKWLGKECNYEELRRKVARHWNFQHNYEYTKRIFRNEPDFGVEEPNRSPKDDVTRIFWAIRDAIDDEQKCNEFVKYENAQEFYNLLDYPLDRDEFDAYIKCSNTEHQAFGTVLKQLVAKYGLTYDKIKSTKLTHMKENEWLRLMETRYIRKERVVSVIQTLDSISIEGAIVDKRDISKLCSASGYSLETILSTMENYYNIGSYCKYLMETKHINKRYFYQDNYIEEFETDDEDDEQQRGFMSHERMRKFSQERTRTITKPALRCFAIQLTYAMKITMQQDKQQPTLLTFDDLKELYRLGDFCIRNITWEDKIIRAVLLNNLDISEQEAVNANNVSFYLIQNGFNPLATRTNHTKGKEEIEEQRTIMKKYVKKAVAEREA